MSSVLCFLQLCGKVHVLDRYSQVCVVQETVQDHEGLAYSDCRRIKHGLTIGFLLDKINTLVFGKESVAIEWCFVYTEGSFMLYIKR